MTRVLPANSPFDSPARSRRRRPGGFALGAVAAVAIAGTLTASAAPPGAGQPANVVPLAPARILDTRTGTGAPLARVGAGQTITLKVAGAGGVPADATGVVINLTVAGPTAGSFVTAWPTGEPRPNASVINFQGGWDIANMITATLGADGSIDLYNDRGSVDLIADVAGFLAPAGGGGGIETTFANGTVNAVPGASDMVFADVTDVGGGGPLVLTAPKRILVNASVAVAGGGPGVPGGFGQVVCAVEIDTVGGSPDFNVVVGATVRIGAATNVTSQDNTPMTAFVDQPAGAYTLRVVCRQQGDFPLKLRVLTASLTALAVAS